LASASDPIRYYLEFTDDNYQTEGYEMGILDLIQVFGSMETSFLTALLANFPLPGTFRITLHNIIEGLPGLTP
jgi:hypothetical protein